MCSKDEANASDDACELREKRDQLIERYQVYVTRVALQLMRTLTLPQHLYDELVANGYLGLVEAAERFKEDSKVPFKKFAFLRIRGAMIDGLRRLVEVKGRSYRKIKALQAAHELREEQLQGASNRESSQGPQRLAEIMDYVAQNALIFRLSADELESEEHSDQISVDPPEKAIEHAQDLMLMRNLVTKLPEKERLVIESYYFQGKSFADLADLADKGFSKSWVSRLHARALKLLKEMYLETLNPNLNP